MRSLLSWKLDGFGLNIAKNVLTTLTNLLDKFTESTKYYLMLNEAVNKHGNNKENFTNQHQSNVNAALKVSNFGELFPHRCVWAFKCKKSNDQFVYK